MSTLTIKWQFDDMFDLGETFEDAGYDRNPRWPLVEHFLYQIKFRGGHLLLEFSDKPGEGAILMDVVGEEGKFYPSLLYRQADGNVQLRVYDDKKKGTEPVSVRRDSHYACNICEDFSLIHRMFKEFYDTGGVSEELLQY